MSSKREQIIAAVAAALAGTSAAVERDSDIPESVPPAGLVIVRSVAPEIEDETIGAVRGWYMALDVPVEMYVAGGDAPARAARLDDLAGRTYAAVIGSAALQSLATYVTATLAELEPLAGEGQSTFLAAQMTVRVEYDADTPV